MKNFKPPYLTTTFSNSGKNAKRRFENILNTKPRKKGIVLFCVFTLMLVSLGMLAACNGSIGIIGGADGPTSVYIADDNQKIKSLYDARIKYVGDAPGVGKIISLLPLPQEYSVSDSGATELQTASEPYELTIKLKNISDKKNDFSVLEKNAAILICLIDNLGSVTYQIGTESTTVTREELSSRLSRPVSEYSQSLSSFSEYYNTIINASANNLESAVSSSILSSGKSHYYDGECPAEGHIILDTDTDKNGNIIVYTLSSYGEYGFENGIFTKISGTGIIPMRITFDSNFNLIEKQLPKDGSYYTNSIKQNFPSKYHYRIFNNENDDYEACLKQEFTYAQAYLNSINRNAEIQSHVKKNFCNIDTDVSNTLFELFYNYPSHIGTFERIENGTRYVYEHKWQPENTTDGNGIADFVKYEYDSGKIVEEYKIQINGSDFKYIKGEPKARR